MPLLDANITINLTEPLCILHIDLFVKLSIIIIRNQPIKKAEVTIMKYEEIKNAIHSIHAGTYANMTTCKTLKTRKEFKDKSIVKISRSTIRSGCDYENLKSTKQGRADGSLPSQNTGLPYGSWISGQEKYFIEHKGNIYLRVTNSPNKSRVTYLVNGIPTDEQEVKAMCLKSEFPTSEKPSVYNVNIDHIVSIEK